MDLIVDLFFFSESQKNRKIKKIHVKNKKNYHEHNTWSDRKNAKRQDYAAQFTI
jgi:hypothetical protein